MDNQYGFSHEEMLVISLPVLLQNDLAEISRSQDLAKTTPRSCDKLVLRINLSGLRTLLGEAKTQNVVSEDIY